MATDSDHAKQRCTIIEPAGPAAVAKKATQTVQPQRQTSRLTTAAGEDSGTESGEDLRLLNPQLLAEVRGALSKLENALPNLDAARRTSIIPLVNKLQSCLKVTADETSQTTRSVSQTLLNDPAATIFSQSSSPSLSPSPHLPLIGNQPTGTIATMASSSKSRKARHTVGVSREELDDARRWLAVAQSVTHQLDANANENVTMRSSSSPLPLSMPQMKIYEANAGSGGKVYKPVKFTPTPASPRPHSVVTPANQQFVSTSDPVQVDCKKKKEEYLSSDDGDVSSTEEEICDNAGAALASASALVVKTKEEQTRKSQPTRFQRRNNKSTRMKRANTIDVPKSNDRSVCAVNEPWYSADDETTESKISAKMAPPPKLKLKTDNDKKFAAFLEQTKQDEAQCKALAYNPSAAGGLQWSNRFSNIKTAFECPKTNDLSPLPQPLQPQQPSTTCTPTTATSSTSYFKPIKQPTFAPWSASTLPRQSFSHAQKSPFKPVTKVAPFHTRSSSNVSSQQTDLHAPKTYYYSPMTDSATAGVVKVSSSQFVNGSVNTNAVKKPRQGVVDQRQYQQAFSDSEKISSHKKPLTPSAHYPKTNYFLNEPSSYLGVHGVGVNSQPCSPLPSVPICQPFVTSSGSGGSSLPTSPNNSFAFQQTYPAMNHNRCHNCDNQEYGYGYGYGYPNSQIQQSSNPFRPTEFSEECAPVAKIMGKPQQSMAVVVNSKTNYRDQQQLQPKQQQQQRNMNPPAASTNTQLLNTYQKLAEKSPSLQNFTKTQPKAWSLQKNSSSTTPRKAPAAETLPFSSPQPVKKQVRILSLNESEENLPEQFFVLNQKNKFESLNTANESVGGAPRIPSVSAAKTFFKPLTAPAVTSSPTIVVQQSRSPPQSPVIMPSVLQKSESWHQMIMEKMKQAKPPSPVRQHIPRAKSTHNLATLPKQYEPTFTVQDITVKQQMVEQFLNKNKQSGSQSKFKFHSNATSSMGRSATSVPTDVTHHHNVRRLDEDFKHVDEAFEMLFEEASGKSTAECEENCDPRRLPLQSNIENRLVSNTAKEHSAASNMNVRNDTSDSPSSRSSSTSSGRFMKANSVTSPFAKFRQLEKQNSLPSFASSTNASVSISARTQSKFADSNSNLTRSASSIKDRLLDWVKAQTKDYKIDNFSTSWNNGLAFCALIHHFHPDAFDYDKLTPQQRRFNFELAFRVAEQEAGIVPLLDVDDMVAMKRPDWKCVFTYVQAIYQRFRASPEANKP